MSKNGHQCSEDVGSFRNHVGNMSKEHDFVGAFDMTFIKAASVTSSNSASRQAALCAGGGGGAWC